MPIVDFSYEPPFGVILLIPTGVRFTGQAGGLACYHPEAEGLFIPLNDGIGTPTLWVFSQHFRGQWSHLADEDAVVINGALRKGKLGYIQVNREKLDQSYEAWVHVLIDTKASEDYLRDFECTEGILVWPNSD